MFSGRRCPLTKFQARAKEKSKRQERRQKDDKIYCVRDWEFNPPSTIPSIQAYSGLQ